MKSLLLFIILIQSLFSSIIEREQKIYTSILHAVFPTKNIIYVWVDNPKKKKIFNNIENVKIIANRDKADILIIYKTKDIKTNKLIFTDGYLIYKHYKKRLIGGFYWQKGRPNLVFLQKNLRYFNITLPDKFQEYIEDT